MDVWPETENDLIDVQKELGRRALAVCRSIPWRPGKELILGGCFVAFSRSDRVRESEGDQVWAAAVVWRPGTSPYKRGEERYRKADEALRGRSEIPRRAQDVEAQAVLRGRVSAPYRAGVLALRQGRMLSEAVRRLAVIPQVLLVDATGFDHPRRAGLALHLGAVLDMPTVGVTNRPLLATGGYPLPARGARSPVILDGDVVGYWVTTRTRARPVLAHAAWRTSAETAADVVLLASTDAARTPVPLQEARRVAREARASLTE